MIGRRSDGPIDVEDELAAREAARADAGGPREEGVEEVENRIEGERGAFSAGLRRQAAPGSKAFMMVVLAFIAIFAVVFIARAVRVSNTTTEKPASDLAKVRNPNSGFKPAGSETPPPGEPLPEVPQNMVVGPDGQLVPALLDANGKPVIGPNGEVVPAIDGTAPLTPVGVQPGTAVATAQPQPVGGGSVGTRTVSPAEALRLRRLGGDFGGGNGGGAVQAVAQQAGADGAGAQGGGAGGELQTALQPLKITPERAGQLGNRDYLLTRGAMLDCVLETKIVSTVAGMTSCYLTRDIYSANGRVVLLDRGSKVVGFYQGGLRQGQSRIFVQWSRVETPKGVIINVDSPGTGPLGEGGVDGRIDNHFMQRFGAAILLTVVDSIGQYAANQGRGSGNNFQIGGNSDQVNDVTGRVLENTINIPPTLYKNQGDRISVYVARDLDFRGVYDVKRR
jgi:type IV secretion system protein VirB10